LSRALRRGGRHFSQVLANPSRRSSSGEPDGRRRMRHTRGYRTGRPAAYFALHQTGFFVPPTLPSARWALTPPFHPYPSEPPCGESNGRFVFCDTVRRRALKRGAHTCLAARAASCPVVSGLSSPRLCLARQSTAPWDVKNSERRPGPKTKREDRKGCRPKCKTRRRLRNQAILATKDHKEHRKIRHGFLASESNHPIVLIRKPENHELRISLRSL
jgi:hypothetical protein